MIADIRLISHSMFPNLKFLSSDCESNWPTSSKETTADVFEEEHNLLVPKTKKT